MLDIVVFNSQVIKVVIRFPRSFGFLWIKRIGINMESGAVGIISSSGLMNCSNMFIVIVGCLLV